MREAGPTFDGEPTMADLLADPIVRAVMERDGVRPEEIWGTVARFAFALCAPAAGEDV